MKELLNYTLLKEIGSDFGFWMWWGAPYNNAQKLLDVLEDLPSEWIENLKNNAGFPGQFNSRAVSDIIYIPEGFKSKVGYVLHHIINKGDLFCSVATNLAVNIVTNDVVYMEYGFLWDGDRSLIGIKKAARKAPYVHPVKITRPQEAEIWVEMMNKQLQLLIK